MSHQLDFDFIDTANQHLCPFCGAAFDEDDLAAYLSHKRHCSTEDYTNG